jgi:hypothetical protein
LSAIAVVKVAVSPEPEVSIIGPLPSYHCQVNDPDPPVTVDVNVADCPLSMVAEVGSDRIRGAESTVTDTAFDVAIAEFVSVNITYTPVSEADGVYDAVIPCPDASAMPVGLASSYHCQEYDPVPPVTIDVIDCPLSMVVGEGCVNIEGVESALTRMLANEQIDNKIRNTIIRICEFFIFFTLNYVVD